MHDEVIAQLTSYADNWQATADHIGDLIASGMREVEELALKRRTADHQVAILRAAIESLRKETDDDEAPGVGVPEHAPSSPDPVPEVQPPVARAASDVETLPSGHAKGWL